MSVENARTLILKLANDATFRDHIAKAPASEKKSLLAAAGFADVTPADVAAARASHGGELSDAELEAVAGGDWMDIFAAIGDAAVEAAAAIAAAMSA
jgi:predicted ribosomally synthesized peptide with nif11-like leader